MRVGLHYMLRQSLLPTVSRPTRKQKLDTQRNKTHRRKKITMVYLIHFNEPFYHARHYLGYTTNARTLPKRLAYHRSGQGAKILKALNGQGIGYEIVKTWKGDRNLERKLKNRKKSSSFCPICQNERNRKPAKTNGKHSTT